MNLLLVIFIFLQAFVINSIQFGYSKIDQAKWRSTYHSCNGRIQSPIYINSSEVVAMGMPALEMIGFHNFLPNSLKLHNNGHSVALSISNDNKIPEYDFEMPYIFGAMLDNEYQFEGLHFHWGEKNSRGSEHVLNDIRYPLELHLIHRNKKYNSVEQALKYRDGLTVLGVFFQLRERKLRHMDMILQQFHSIENYNANIKVNQSLKLSSFLPVDTDTFYTYKGSLTTPPCSEVVTWILFPEPVMISFDQMNMFRKLKDINNTNLADNYRDFQPIGNRKVFLRKPEWKNSKYFFDSNFLKWIWFK